jgi:hypothetical protein
MSNNPSPNLDLTYTHATLLPPNLESKPDLHMIRTYTGMYAYLPVPVTHVRIPDANKTKGVKKRLRMECMEYSVEYRVQIPQDRTFYTIPICTSILKTKSESESEL